MAEIVIGIVTLVVMVGIYFAGVRQGRKQSDEQRKHEWQLESDRRHYELVRRLADQYIEMGRGNKDRGPHLLARLGLDQLGDDKSIRDAIELMRIGDGVDPWWGAEKDVEGVNLVGFFKYVREKKVDFFKTKVAEVVQAMKSVSN